MNDEQKRVVASVITRVAERAAAQGRDCAKGVRMSLNALKMRVSEGWITIGAKAKKNGDGKRRGGMRVYIKDGRITKGPSGTVGNSPNDPRGKNKTAELDFDKAERDKKHANERRKRGLPRADTKLGKAIASAVGDDLADQEGFHELVNDVWGRKRQEASEVEASLSDVIRQFIPASKRGNFTQEVRRAVDPDKIPAFDEMVEYAQRVHPHILDFDPESSVDDPEDALFRLLQRGKIEPPAKHSDEIIEEAFDIAESMGFGRDMPSMSRAEQEALEAVPFAVRMGAAPWYARYLAERHKSDG